MNEILITMSVAEARAITDRIKSNISETRQLLLKMHERNGWAALGYSSWREYGQAEFGYSESRVYQLMDAARVERNFSTIVEKTAGPIRESHLRPLTGLKPDQQRAAYKQVVESAPDGRVTAAHVSRVAIEYAPYDDGWGGREEEPDPDELEAESPAALDEVYPAANILHSSETNEWYTPARYVEAARLVMGAIDLDPASIALANETVKAAIFYTQRDDGLRQPWSGRVFLNPPYGKNGGESNQGLWSRRLIDEYRLGTVKEAVLLVNATPGDRWWSPLWDFPICFPGHRIQFYGAESPAGRATHSNAFIYLGPDIERFARVFGQFGPVVVRFEPGNLEEEGRQ